MKNEVLLLIDLSKNYSKFESNKYYIYLNRGNINLENCTQIKLNRFKSIKKNSYNTFLKFLKNSFSKKKQDNFFHNELEIMNLRIDRYDFVDRMINLITIKKLIKKKKIKNIKIISDNPSTLNIFDNLSLNIEKEDLSKKIKSFKFSKLKIIKFYIKTFILLSFLKLMKKFVIFKKESEFFISLYPNYFSYGKKNFFEKERNICNFLLTDETHLNASLFKLIKNLLITKNKKILNLEQFIKFKDLYKLILNSFAHFKKHKDCFQNNTIIENLDFKNEILSLYNASLINRAKLEIYTDAIPRFLKTCKIKKINLYLFEYNFGFFLIRSIREYSKKIKIIGYQHGIFSNQLTWFDLIVSLKSNKVFLPDYILSTNKYSLKDYKSKLNKKVYLKSNHNANKKFLNSINIKKKSDRILIFPGTHDIKDIYFFIKNKYNFSNNKVFYFKLHPKNKFYFNEEEKIKKIKNLKGYSFSDVIISQTSSLVYDFLISKKKFSVIDLDYRRNLVSTNLKKKINFIY